MKIHETLVHTSPVPRPGMLPPTLKVRGTTLQVDPESVEYMLRILVRQLVIHDDQKNAHLPIVGVPRVGVHLNWPSSQKTQ